MAAVHSAESEPSGLLAWHLSSTSYRVLHPAHPVQSHAVHCVGCVIVVKTGAVCQNPQECFSFSSGAHSCGNEPLPEHTGLCVIAFLSCDFALD